MAHWHLKHKKTGDEQFVQGLEGYDPKEWTVTKLHREPGHHEQLMGGKLKVVEDIEARSMAEARFNNMHKGDFMLMIEALEARVQALENLP